MKHKSLNLDADKIFHFEYAPLDPPLRGYHLTSTYFSLCHFYRFEVMSCYKAGYLKKVE